MGNGLIELPSTGLSIFVPSVVHVTLEAEPLFGDAKPFDLDAWYSQNPAYHELRLLRSPILQAPVRIFSMGALEALLCEYVGETQTLLSAARLRGLDYGLDNKEFARHDEAMRMWLTDPAPDTEPMLTPFHYERLRTLGGILALEHRKNGMGALLRKAVDRGQPVYLSLQQGKNGASYWFGKK